MNKSYLGLDLVRFLAAFMVMAVHLCYWVWLDGQGRPDIIVFQRDLAFLAPFTSFGWVGVQIFFVLSGFVIAISAQGKSAADFARGRALRLYPAVWICGTLTVAAGLLAGQSEPLSDYLRTLAIAPIGPWVDGVYWTLGVEIAFYALVAAVVAARGPRHIATLGIALGLASALYWAAFLLDPIAGGQLAGLFAWGETRPAKLLLVPHGCFFALGILLQAAVREGMRQRYAVTAALCILAGLVQIGAETAQRNAEMPAAGQMLSALAPSSVWLAAQAATAAAVFCNDTLWRWFGRWSAPIRTIGLATYPLYLLHCRIGTHVMRALLPIGPMAALAVATAIVLLLAFLVTLYAEPVLRQMLRRALYPAPPRPAPAARPASAEAA